MRKRIRISTYFFLITLSFLTHPLHATELLPSSETLTCPPEPGLHKLRDGLWCQPVPKREGLYAFMEEVTDTNRGAWKSYGSTQTPLYQGLIYTGEGSNHFRKALENTLFENDQLWIAYITDKPSVDAEPGNRNIKMFVTVTSNPNAFLSTHLGISLSNEALLPEIVASQKFESLKKQTPPASPQAMETAKADLERAKVRGLSLPLHAFAARVTQQEFPHVRFMVNCPAPVMRDIIAKALPNHSYIGTREEQQRFFAPVTLTFENFEKENRKKIEHYVRANYEERPDLTQEEKEKAIQKAIQEDLKSDYETAIHHYVPSDGTLYGYGEPAEQKLRENFEKHPPIISWPGSRRGVKMMWPLVIYDPQNPSNILFKIAPDINNPFQETSVKNHGWLLQNGYGPDGSTRYLAVDLEALAKSPY